MNKKGVIGEFITGFVGTIILLIILVAFWLTGALLSSADNTEKEILIMKEKDTGLGAVLNYQGYKAILTTKKEIDKGTNIQEAINKGRAVYEK